MGQRRWTQRILSLILLTLALAITPQAADAHAELVSSTPESGAELRIAPTKTTIEFTEPIRPVRGGIRLLNEQGTRLQLPAPQVRGHVVTLTLPSLAAGAYVVVWRVVSADGHPIRGAYTFRVAGAGDQRAAARAASALFAASTSRPEVGAVAAVLRFAALSALLTLIGFACYVRIAAPDPTGSARLRRATKVVGVAGTLAGCLAAAVYGPYVTGAGLRSMTDGVLLDSTLGDPSGQAIVLRTVVTMVLAFTVAERLGLSTRLPRRVLDALIAGTVSAGAVAQARTGHGAVGDHAALAAVGTVLHVVAGGVWVGGLAALVVTRPRAREVWWKFSKVATAAVLTLFATGAFASWRQIGGPSALPSTVMGRVLLVKLSLVAIAVALGFGTRRHLRAADVGRQRRIRIEAAVALLVVVPTAVLTGVVPGRVERQRPTAVTMRGEQLLVDLTVAPARPGANALHLYVLGSDGGPLPVASIEVSATLPERGIGPIPLRLVRAGSNHFQALGAAFPFAGRWRVEATIRVDEFTQETLQASVTIR